MLDTITVSATNPYNPFGVDLVPGQNYLQIKRRLHQACVDAAALTGAFPPKERRENAHGEQRRSVMIDGRDADRPRPSILIAGNRH